MRKIFYLLLIFTLLFSCQDFLEPQSSSEFVPKTATALNELLLGEAYPKISGDYLNVFLEMLTDDIECAPYCSTPTFPERLQASFAAYTWQPNLFLEFSASNLFPGTYNIWEHVYAKILGANAVLDYIDEVSGKPEMKHIVKAQALALRGYYYYYLVNIFGQPYSHNKSALGVPLKLTSAIELNDLKRNTVEEVYHRITTDLLEAENLYQTLPESQQWQLNYRTSLPMVQLLLSRVYLYTEEWETAAEYAEKVIDDYAFTLIDLNELPTPTSSEPYYNFHSVESSEMIWLYGTVNDVIYFSNIDGKVNPDNQWDNRKRGIYKASWNLLQTYEEFDLRPEKYIVDEKDADYKKPLAKMKVTGSYIPQAGTEFARSFRLSEAYLNSAEASAMLHKAGNGEHLPKALKRLNELRIKRYKTGTYMDLNLSNADDLISFVREERRRELCFEDHRWFDLRRYGMPEIKHSWAQDENTTLEYVLSEKDAGYTIPIPEEALQLNKELIQNPLAPVRN